MTTSKHNKDLQIHLRVSQKEADLIRNRMEVAGVRNMSAYALRMMLHGYILRIDMSDIKEILRLVQRSGNNINQIAKKANQTGSIYENDIKEILSSQKEIMQKLGTLLDRFNQID